MTIIDLDIDMKSFSRIIGMSVLSMLLVWGLLSCRKDDGVAVSEYLKLVPDKTLIEPNGSDAVTFTVEYDGIDVTDEAAVYREDGTAAELTFVSATEGSYGFYAEYKGERSATVTIVATSSLPPMPEDPEPSSTDFARRSLLMLFTSTDCSACPYAISAMNLLSQSPSGKKYVLVECHSRAKSDPAYYDGPLMSIYGSSETPYVSVDMDKELYVLGGNPDPRAGMSAYNALISRSASLRPAKAGIAASSAMVGSNLVVSMSVKVSETGEYKAGAWLLEDGIYGKQLNTGATGNIDFDTHNDCLRYAQYTGTGSKADYTGMSLGTVNAGEEAGCTFSIPVEEGWNVENCHLALFVTAEDDGSFYVNNVAACEIGGTVEYEYE